jgi:hypothetical protein
MRENGTEGIDVGWMVGWIVDLISIEVGLERSDGFERG